jgi:hypothetical protein
MKKMIRFTLPTSTKQTPGDDPKPSRGAGKILFPNSRGTRLSAFGVRYLLVTHVKATAHACR